MDNISRIVQGSIKNMGIVRLVLFCLIVAGVLGLVNINKDEFPTFEIQQGLVAAVYPGADVHQVEEEVGKPLEELLFSMSEINRSQTKLYCKDGICYIYTDLTTSTSKKREVWSGIKLKIDAFKQTLPPGVLAVVVIDEFSAVSSLLIAMESEDKGFSEMSRYADQLSEKLRTIPELASVQVIGAQEEEIAVSVDVNRLSAYGISPTSLLMDYQTSGMQALGGSFESGSASSPVHVPKTVTSEQELADRIILSTPDNHILRLKDVAVIERRCKEPSSMVRFNGHTALVVSVEMRPDNDIVRFGKNVDEVIGGFMASMPDSVKITRITDQSKVVASSVWSFLRDLVISMLVVILVMLMLFPMKSALIASSGVPVCTIIGIALMYMSGIYLNIVSLAALIVVLGMIVDDSVITMDGYMDKLSKGLGRVDAACKSAEELFVPMFIATSAISLMFFPLIRIITGYLGDFVKTFPWVIAFTLMTSLTYAVLVVPSLEVKYISSAAPARDNIATRAQKVLFRSIQRFYDWMQAHCFKHAYLTILTGVATIVLGLLIFSRLNVQMMPMALRPIFAVEIYLDPEASLHKTAAVSDSLSALLRKDSRISSVTEFIGTGTPRFHCTYQPLLPGKNVAQLIVNTNSNQDTESFLAEMESKYEFIFPEAVIHFKQMDYQGTSSPLEVTVTGDDYDSLVPVATQIESYLRGVSQVKWVHSDIDHFRSAISVEMDSDEAARLGVNRALMNLSIAGTLNGLPLTTLVEDGRNISVNLYAVGDDEESYDKIGNILVPTYMPGVMVPVRQVADVVPEWNPESLVRIDGRPAIQVGADMKYGYSQPVASKQLKNFIATRLELPEGVEIKFGGLDSTNRQVIPEVGLSFLAAVLVLFFALLLYFKKISLAILTMVTSSLCLFGASVGLWLFRLDFGMTAVLGLISLVGIIVRNGIILFEYADKLRYEQGYSVKDAASEAGKRRIRPIFLTSCTTALGVLPMIIIGDTLWQPLGVVICFGTMLSIFLITLIMPVSYWLLFKKADKSIPKHEQ